MKKTTDSKNQKEPSTQTAKKGTSPKGEYSYKNISTLTVNDKSKISTFISKEDPRVSKRLKECKIKISDIIKVNKFHQQQFLDGKLKGDFIRYWVFLKNKKKVMLNFSKSHKIESK